MEINNKLSDAKYLKCIVNMMPKKKNGLLYSKRVTQIASLFCMDENANMYVLCAVAKDDTHLLIELRQISVNSTEKFDADVITSTNNFSADTQVKTETKEEAQIRKARNYITKDALKEEPMGPYCDNRQEDILIGFLIDSKKVSFTYEDLVEMQDGQPDEEIEKMINDFFDTYEEKKDTYIEDYLNSGYWKLVNEKDCFAVEDGILKGYKGDKKKVIVPNGVRVIDDNAFHYASWINEIVLPEGLVQIGECAFEGCSKLQKINIPGTVEKIGSSAFASASSLKTVNLSCKIEKIDGYVWGDCESLEEIKLPDTLKKIGEEAFSGCKCLKEIIIPASVKKICEEAFCDCGSLKEVTIKGDSCIIEKDAFLLCENLTVIASDNSEAKKYALKNNLKFKKLD